MSNFSKSRPRFALTWLSFLVAAAVCSGGPIFFTNEGSFNTAIGGATLTLESFESNFVDGTTSVAFPNVTVGGDENLIRTNPSTFATAGTGTIGIIDFNFDGNFVTFTFNSPINAFSVDILAANDFGGGGNVILGNSNGASQVLYSGLGDNILAVPQ